MSNELLLEDTFISHLASLKRIILENSSSSLSNKHDPYLDHKAAQLVNEEVRRTLVKMTSLRGNSEPDAKRHISDKIAAYSYVGANLSNEIERMVAKKVTRPYSRLLSLFNESHITGHTDGPFHDSRRTGHTQRAIHFTPVTL